MRRILLLVSLICALPRPGAAQIAPKLEFERRLADALEVLVPAWANHVYASRIEQEVRRNEDAILEELRWTGHGGPLKDGGYLIRVRTQWDPLTNNTAPLEGPQFLGVGKDPASALIAATVHGSHEAVGNEWLRQKSHFIWLTAERRWYGGYRLLYGPITDSESLTNIELAAQASRDLADAVATSNRGWIMERALENLRRESAGRAQFSRAAEALDEYRQREARIREYQANMARDLAEAAAADRLSQTLGTLSTVLSMATLVVQVQAALPRMYSGDSEHAATPEELIRRVEAHEQVMRDAARRREPELQRMRTEQIESGKRVQDTLEGVRFPRNLRNRILLH